MVMASCLSILSLPHREVGSRKIRFIYLVDLASFRLTECPNQSRVVPLFLGADVLSNTGTRTENQPRNHARFSKKELATKLRFSPEFRFQGLKVSAAENSMWFYSIQGLFRVAFEMYSKQDQLAVMENLQDIWKSQINDSPLKPHYHLNVYHDSSPPLSILDIPLKRNPSLHQTDEEMRNACGNETADTSVDHDYCFSRDGIHNKKTQLLVWRLRQKLHSLEKQLSSPSQSFAEQLDTVLVLVECVDQYTKGNLEEKDATVAILALLKAKDWTKDSVYSSYLLTSIGRWLGEQFHAAHSSISHRVEGFKVQHIEQISDLPPAEELAKELFPEAMQALLLHWMGLCEESTLEKRHCEYPILLLILEFANHNLITGVAHVLYSSLICK
ncbi:uncharacterized protein si:ch211-110p13.9 [Oryzias melastigma]|uniref:uncharacterized protein si:ch211-110p13.9 n=1 Tax=Oryzias melastigma TaxID=30732 RepID=UPI000CF7F0B1|nr:uncharacterized protein si:ch211-110p13.9 [Oryzias melastigma]